MAPGRPLAWVVLHCATMNEPKTRTKAEIRAERLSWAIWAAGVYSRENKANEERAKRLSSPE